jgi:glucose-6-phosphate 1-dehydrogenase
MEIPKNCIVVIFGASGDLTKRKLIPGIFALQKQGILPEGFGILGIGRTELSEEEFRNLMKESIINFSQEKDYEENTLSQFLSKLYYLPIDTKSAEDYKKVKDSLVNLNEQFKANNNILFYFSTPPSMYEIIAKNLGIAGLNSSDGYRRIVVEKPFGYDLESEKKLNAQLLKIFNEDQIYRIDHYLGKETVQNVLVTRFSNGIFEPLWNRNYVHHIEITAAESLGVGSRGGYYDSSGALRDMVQNHLLQLVGLTAMEPPSSFDSNSIRNETLKVFQSLRQIKEEEVCDKVIRGQYLASKIRGENVVGYREESGVNPNSKTETYVALKFYIDNWRWGGVPFYIRTGKRMPTHVTEIVIHFKPTPHYLFSHFGNNFNNTNNQLIIRIQPDEGILLKFGLKVPGAGYNVQTVNMDFHYSDLAHVHVSSAYERLLYDAMMGDSTLYLRGDAVEAAWKFIAPIQNAWNNNPSIKIFGYPAGTWGPEHADKLIDGYSLAWRYPCKNLTDDGTYCEL